MLFIEAEVESARIFISGERAEGRPPYAHSDISF